MKVPKSQISRVYQTLKWDATTWLAILAVINPVYGIVLNHAVRIDPIVLIGSQLQYKFTENP